MVRGHAKVNLSLDIVGPRPDGYHDLETVMARLWLHDRVFLRETPGLTAHCNHPSVPSGGNNLALKAATHLRDYLGIARGACIVIEKSIPVGAGLGGGSADAAAVLVGLNRLWGAGLSLAELTRIGAALGADVPFCVAGRCALATGRGEVLRELAACPEGWLVLARPPGLELPTRRVYSEFDRLTGGRGGGFTTGVMAALATRDLQRLAGAIGNAFQPVVEAVWPQVGRLRRLLLSAGALGACLTGSGPVVMALVSDRLTAERTVTLVRRGGHEGWVTRFLTGKGGRGRELARPTNRDLRCSGACRKV